MSHPYDTLRLASGAALIFTPCPGTKNTSIEEAVSTLKAAGANALITLMPADELERFEASALPRLCADQESPGFTCLSRTIMRRTSASPRPSESRKRR
jgi:hypothetical protein